MKAIRYFGALAVLPLALMFHPHNDHGQVRNLTAGPDCTLQVPANPLSATGLATPYVLHSAGAACSESNADTAAFVQATILNPATGAVSVYDPVVRDPGAAPLRSGPSVDLPDHAVVTIWTGFNGNVLKLTGPGAKTFTQFPQQSYANSPAFMQALLHSIAKGETTVPALGIGSDGLPCPTTRDFSIVDQDPSDNNPQVNQFGIGNASDEKTLDSVDAALGCAPWTVEASGPGATSGTSTSGPLQEAQAAVEQADPQALIPGNDPFTLLHGQPSLALQNLLRAQLGETPAPANGTTAFCRNLAAIGEPRLKADRAAELLRPNSLPYAVNLADQMAYRFQMTWANLDCQALTGMPSPINATLDNGVVTAVTYA